MLIFAQHIAFLDGEEKLWIRLRDLKKRAREKKIAIEVTDRATAVRAAATGADIVQVDKMEPEELRRLVRAVREAAPAAVVAAAGGINENNARAYAATGVDLLVTSAMYWGKPADIAVRMEAAD